MVAIQLSSQFELLPNIPNMVRVKTLLTIHPNPNRNIRMVIIELKQYGDFDILQTDSVWYNAELTSFNPIDFPTDRTTNAARAYLRDHGFTEMKTKSCVVGGDL